MVTQARGIAAHSFFNEEVLDGNPKKLDDSLAQQSFTLLTLLYKPDDMVALRSWLGFGSNNLRRNEYRRLREHCSHNYISIRETLRQMLSGDLFIPYTQGILERFRILTQQLADLQQLRAPEIFDRLFPPETDWAKKIRQQVEPMITEWTIHNLYDSMLTNITQPEIPTDVEYIRIMSLHKSKGLTADHVIVTGLLEGIIPSRGGDDLTFDDQRRRLEEQRRLFYVAITRPKQTLVLSSVITLPRDLAHRIDAQVDGGDQYSCNTIASTFLAELGADCPRPIMGHEWRY